MSNSNKSLRIWLKNRNTTDTQSMPIHLQRGKWKKKGINLFRRLSIVFLTFAFRKYKHPPKPKLDKIESILIIPNSPIGDLILSSPIWRTLKDRNPLLRIGVALSAINAKVVESENLDHTYDLFSPGLFRLIREIFRARKDRWDVVLVPAGFYKAARFSFISRIIAGKGITATMHSARPWRYARIYSFCFTRPRPWECVPTVDQHFSLIEQTFDISIPQEERIPHFTVSQSILQEVRNKTEELLKQNHASRMIVINLEAKNSYREWGFENVRALTQMIEGWRDDILIVLIASKNFRIYYKKDLDSLRSERVLIFETQTIQHVAALIECSALVISPDTAIVHIAAALQKKMIVFYPAPDEWLPYGAPATILYPERWMPVSSIPVDEVFTELQKLLPSDE